jgi:hypothetical protein
MRWTAMLAAIGFVSLPVAAPATAQAADDVSAEWGRHIAIIGGCNDCHTEGYEAAGQIDPALALKGKSVGFQGPWGTTYAANLRLVAASRTEDEFLQYLKTFQARPPMPWYNVHEMEERDIRSLYVYIKSLGEPGDPAPAYVPPGQEPTMPYNVFAPPVVPGQ